MLKLTGNLEQEIMNTLWSANQPLKPAEVLEALQGELAYTTVMTILQRLYKKGLLKREKEGNAFKYRPSLSKDEHARDSLDQVYEGILNAYGPLAISHFLKSIKGNSKYRALLNEYLAKSDNR